MPAYALVGVGTPAFSLGGGSIAPGLPPGHALDKLLLWLGVSHSSTGDVATPAGYSTQFSKTQSGHTWLVLAAKVDNGAEIAPVTTSDANNTLAEMACFSGNQKTLAGILDNSATTSNTSPTTINTPAMTPNAAGCLVVAVGAFRKNSVWTADPAGFTTLDHFANAATNQSLMWAYSVQPGDATAIAASAFTVQLTNSTAADGALISFVPMLTPLAGGAQYAGQTPSVVQRLNSVLTPVTARERLRRFFLPLHTGPT